MWDEALGSCPVVLIEDIDDAPTVDTAKLEHSHDQLSRLRIRFGWHDARKVLPTHGKRVCVWTNKGEYHGYYDHKWNCWRLTRDGLTVTHWREQCGPGDWPAK